MLVMVTTLRQLILSMVMMALLHGVFSPFSSFHSPTCQAPCLSLLGRYILIPTTKDPDHRCPFVLYASIPADDDTTIADVLTVLPCNYAWQSALR